jgi:hypothetical protein
MGDATGRPGWRSSVLGVPGAEFSCGKLGIGARQEKRSKKNETKALEKLTPLMGIRSQCGFPQRLFERQRSTLNTRSFGPKDGEQLTPITDGVKLAVINALNVQSHEKGDRP